MSGLSFFTSEGWASKQVQLPEKKESLIIKKDVESKKLVHSNINKILPKVAFDVINDPEKNYAQLALINHNIKGKFRLLAWTTLTAVLSKVNLENITSASIESMRRDKKEYLDYQKFIESTYTNLSTVLKKKIISSKEKPRVKMQAAQCFCDLLRTKNHISRSQSSLNFLVSLSFSSSSFVCEQACFCIRSILSDEYEEQKDRLLILRCILSNLKSIDIGESNLQMLISCLGQASFTYFSSSDNSESLHLKGDKTHLSAFKKKIEKQKQKVRISESTLKRELRNKKSIHANADIKSAILSIYCFTLKMRSLNVMVLDSIIKNLCKQYYIASLSLFVDLSQIVKSIISQSDEHHKILSLINAYIELYLQIDISRSVDLSFVIHDLKKRIVFIDDTTLLISLLKKIYENRLLTVKDMFHSFSMNDKGKYTLKAILGEKFDEHFIYFLNQDIPPLIPGLYQL